MLLIEKQSLSLKILIDIIPQVRGRLAEAEAKKKAEEAEKIASDVQKVNNNNTQVT